MRCTRKLAGSLPLWWEHTLLGLSQYKSGPRQDRQRCRWPAPLAVAVSAVRRMIECKSWGACRRRRDAYLGKYIDRDGEQTGDALPEIWHARDQATCLLSTLCHHIL